MTAAINKNLEYHTTDFEKKAQSLFKVPLAPSSKRIAKKPANSRISTIQIHATHMRARSFIQARDYGKGLEIFAQAKLAAKESRANKYEYCLELMQNKPLSCQILP